MRLRALAAIALSSACSGGAADAPAQPARDDAASAPEVAVAEDAPQSESAPDACVPAVLSTVPSDFMFLIDTSASWSTKSDRFAGARDAVLELIGSETFGRAATFFPRLDAGATTCASGPYRTLDIDWSAPSAAFSSALEGVTFAGDGAFGPGLQGAIELSRARFQPDPRRTVSVIVVTDATPGTDESCTSFAGVADIAADGFAAGKGKSVHTHVVSVIGKAVAPEHAGTIDAIVASGGGFAAVVNGSRDDVRGSTRTTLANIVARMRTCTYALPPGSSVPSEVTLEFPGAPKETVKRVADATACTGSSFYVDDEAAPTTLTLCSGEAGVGGFCERVFLQARAAGAPTVTTQCTP